MEENFSVEQGVADGFWVIQARYFFPSYVPQTLLTAHVTLSTALQEK